jgi:hypothetical protein
MDRLGERYGEVGEGFSLGYNEVVRDPCNFEGKVHHEKR